MREEVRQILGGADEAGVSADGRLAFAVLKEMGAVQFESAAASNVAASKSVANNQQPVEPWLAAAQPDGPVNDADDDAMVDAAVVDADDADEANEVDAAGVVNAGVDEVGEVGRPSCMPRQASALPVGGCEPNACEAEPVAAVRCEGRPEVWKSSFACDYVCRFAENFVTLRYGNECN